MRIIVMALVVTVPCVSPGASHAQVSRHYAITGTLQRPNGEPAIRETVYLVYVTDQGTFARLGMVHGKIQVVNPGGKVAKTGRFRVEFDDQFLRSTLDTLKTKRFSLATMVDGRAAPLSHPDAKIGVFFELPELFGKDTERDFGTIKMSK